MNYDNDNIAIFCAHPDDEIIGCGGLVQAKKHKNEFSSFIFSNGELTHPWLKEKEIKKIRQKESIKAAKIVGISKTTFFEISEKEMEKVLTKEKEKYIKKIIEIIKKENISLVITHSKDDPHKLHRKVYQIIYKAITKINISNKQKIKMYTFDIWHLFKIKKEPYIVIDISNYFPLKLKAIKAFKSQFISNLSMIPTTFIRNKYAGLRFGHKYSEIFYKIY